MTTNSPTPAPNGNATSTATKPDTSSLPKLSAEDYRVYNSMADHMEHFHNNFKSNWQTLYKAATTGSRPTNLSVAGYIRLGEQFCHHLTIHHTIEEQHIYPVLATRMPAFREEVELISQHKEIHEGLEKMEKYFADCRSGERELRLGEMKELMDGFGEVLWEHMDDEVRQLGADEMRRVWSLDEMRRMPF